MCDPVTIGALALTAVGSVTQMSAANSAQNAAKDATNTEAQIQQQKEREANQLFAGNLHSYDNQVGDVATAAAKRGTALNAAVMPSASPTGGDYLPGAASAPSVITGDAESKLAGESSQAHDHADALANLGALSDVIMGDQFRNQDTNALLNENAMERRNELDILPTALEEAKLKARSPLGDILVGLGTVGTTLGPAASAKLGLGSVFGASPSVISGAYNGEGRGWDVSQVAAKNGIGNMWGLI